MQSCPDPLLGPQMGELLEEPLQTSREHLAGLDPYNLGGVDRRLRDEDECPGRLTDLALAD